MLFGELDFMTALLTQSCGMRIGFALIVALAIFFYTPPGHRFDM